MRQTSGPDDDYSRLFEQIIAPVALVSLRNGPVLIAATQGFLNTLQVRRSEVVGRKLDIVLVPAESGELALELYNCLANSGPYKTAVKLRSPVNSKVFTMTVHDAETSGFPEHVLLEAVGEGAQRRSRLARLLEEDEQPNLSMIYIHNLRSQRIRYVDGGLAERLGLPTGVVGITDLQTRARPEELSEAFGFEAADDPEWKGDSLSSTSLLRDVDGGWRLINFRSRVLRRDAKGAARTVIGCAMDISNFAAAAVEAAGASVQRAEEAERARIGRELHDSTAQYLVASGMAISQILQRDVITDETRIRLLEVQGSLDAAQGEMRSFAYFLHPPELLELGLTNALDKYCHGFARRSGLDISFRARQPMADVGSEAAHALFRVGQEALMNVYRHAFARKVDVSLQSHESDLILEVRDDGVGAQEPEDMDYDGVGMTSMRTRMLSVGGDLSWESHSPGFSLRASVPYRSEEAPPRLA